MHVSRSFLLLLASLSLSLNCRASPLPDSPKPSSEMGTWGRRDEAQKVHLGYRYVDKESVLIYARAGRELAKAAGKVVQAKPNLKGDEAKWVIEGTLTDIKASGTVIGEGAYLTPSVGGWEGEFVCEVWGDLEKFKEAPKEFVTNKIMAHTPESEEAWNKILSGGKTMDTTILAVQIPGQVGYTMRIPPHYLKPSPPRILGVLTGQRKPKVDLGITVRCVSETNIQALSIHNPADWGQWWPNLNPSNQLWMMAIHSRG
ncbi:hypothetical protein F5879DRAFT_79522 [Lentinula edodes]|nr:hypothetical protein F5879DRAFT_79522 [Lentinula edodes]